MDLSFTSEEEQLRQRVRRFLEEEIPKSGLKSASEGREDKAWLAKAKAWQRKLYEAGYVALAWPKEYGGQAMDPVKQSIVNEEMVRANAPYLVGSSGLGMFGPTLISWGDEEQKKRFLDRLQQPEKNWKFSTDDLRERERWNDYMNAYEEMIANTATPHAPWFVMPADNKWFTRLAVAAAIVDTLDGLNLSYPKVDAQKRRELKAAQKLLSNNRHGPSE